MPLVRFEVRNEYGLGTRELYKGGGNDDEDPKAVLEGVTVAGLVGILRQLGDLAEFAAEVFHDLQEQVMTTASRSHKMIARVQQMEAALPALEKVVLAQKNHIHFAYTDGLEWHPKIQTEKNHLIYSDLPRFIMDSYEESRDPPSFHLLDKFDNGGPGSCLRRYSDPSFFKKALVGSELQTTDKVHREKKARKSKKMGLRQRNGEVSHAVSVSRESGGMPFASPNIYGQSSATETFSTSNMRSKSELRDRSTYFDARTMEIRSTSFDSRAKLDHTECVFDTRHEDQDHNELSTSRLKFQCDSSLPGEQESDEYDYYTQQSVPEQGVPSSSSVTWDEKIEIVKSTYPQLDKIFNDEKQATELLPSNSDLSNLEKKAATLQHVDPVDILSDSETISESLSDGNQFDEVGSEPDSFVDALTTMESEIETDIEFQTKREVELSPTKLKNKGIECEAEVMDMMITQNSESFDVESPTTSYRLSHKQIAQNISNLVSSEELMHAKPPQVNDMSSDPEFSVDTSLCSVSRANDSDSAIDCLAQMNVMPSDPDFSLETGLSSISRENDYDSAINDPSSFGSNIHSSESPLGDKIIRRLHESEEPPAKVSVAPSNNFWTNGGLLGLQPSKPPDFCVTNVVNESSMAGTKDDGHPLSSEAFTSQTHSNGSIRKLDMLVEMPEHKKENPNSGGGNGRSHDILCRNDLPRDQLVRKTGSMIQNIDHSASSMLSHEKKDDDMSKKNAGEMLSAVSKAKIEKSVDSHCSSSSIDDVHRPGLTETSFTTHGADLIIPSSEAGQQNGGNPSNMHGLNHRLPVNGFGRKLSLVHDDTSEPAGSLKTGLMKLQAQYNKQEGQNRVVCQPCPKQNPNKQVRHVSPLNSPPLEHMKISFHPIKVFEPSSLKLKFPDGHQFQESIKDDMFPSFQLLPELSTSLQDLDYESDDDTFCRSSPCTSEEHMSQHSDSNSDQWESGETTESKEHEIYDAFRRFSSDESISSPFELEGIAYDGLHRDSNRSPDTSNGFIPFHDDPLLDFPSFDAVNPVTSKQERDLNSDPKDHELVLRYPNEPTPPSLPIEPTPPPLPPLQWRIMKHNFSEVEDEQDTPSKDADHSHNLENLGTSPAQQLKLAPSMQPHIEEATPSPPEIKLDQLNLNRNTESNQASNGKVLEERGDFLHQIRTQSFSLRRTTPVKQTPTPSPTTNTKVSAILEKANAIRQAFVGSDDGGDDENWSDD